MADETKKMNEKQIVLVDVQKLSEALKRAFEGIAMVFDSIGLEKEIPVPATCDEAIGEGSEEAPEEKPAEAEAENPQVEANDALSVTMDDITKIIVRKIKQDRSNNEKIGQMLKKYSVSKVSELPSTKYEAFLTDLSEI